MRRRKSQRRFHIKKTLIWHFAMEQSLRCIYILSIIAAQWQLKAIHEENKYCQQS